MRRSPSPVKVYDDVTYAKHGGFMAGRSICSGDKVDRRLYHRMEAFALVFEDQATSDGEDRRRIVREDVADDPFDVFAVANLDKPAQEFGGETPAPERVGDEQRELGFVAHGLREEIVDGDDLLLA